MNSKTILGISLAAVFAVSMIFVISIPKAEAGGKHSPDYRITGFGIDGSGNPSLTVAGTVGGTTPEGPTDIHAYLLSTDVGVFAVASHCFIDDGEQTPPACDFTWHSHKVTSVDPATLCFTVDETGSALGVGTSTVSVSGTGATSMVVTPFGFTVATVLVTVTDESQPCIKHIMNTA